MKPLKNLSLKGTLAIVLAFGSSATPVMLPVGIVGVSVTQTSCKETDLGKTAEAAKDIGGEVRDLVDAVGKAYTQKLITLAQKDKFADLLAAVARGGQKGVDVIVALQQQGVKVPNADQRSQLNKVFDDDVIAPFLTFLTELGKLSDDSAIAIRAAMASVRTAILFFSSRVGRTDVIDKINAIQLREVWKA
jgi:hypothetical protein